MANLNNSTLRQHLLEMRAADALDLEKFKLQEQKLNSQILSFLEALELKKQNFIHTIAFYYPIKGEPDITNALLEWSKQNNARHLAIPVTKTNEPLNFAKWDEETELSEGLYKIPEPKNPQLIAPDLIIAPCLGWQIADEALWRIGYGAGYYDRTMAQLSNSGQPPLLIGVGFDNYQVNSHEWQASPHDAPLNALITESRVYELKT